jgi:putative oxidoreductase
MRATTTARNLTDAPMREATSAPAESSLKGLVARAEVATYAALRIVAGAMFAFHGAQKVLGWHAPFMPPVGSELWIGGVLELVGGILIAAGLLVRPAAFVLAGQMAVAYIQFHWKGAFAGGMWIPGVNKGELAALYCFVFLFIAAHGPGRAALGPVLRRSRRGVA